jgi:NAD(P)-dependent dehydrogenase (short-subunit alcohol dehydrogenase family)
MELENKNIIITGASSGIGAAAARLFAQEGASVVLTARREHELKKLAEEINDGNSGRAAVLSGDVADPKYAQALVAFAEQTFGKLDGAFNNVGVVGDMAPVTSMTLENWNSVMAVNLTAAFLAAQAQIPALMRPRQYARIVHRWIRNIGLDDRGFGTHPLRRTKVAQLYRKSGNLRAVQLLLGHAKIETTVRYLR